MLGTFSWSQTLACNLWLYRFLPFLRWWPMVNRNTLRADATAGVTGALIVLPQGVAFATIAGLPPEYGLYAAMVPAVIAALFGSSWHLVSGPTTAISIAVFASVSPQAPIGTPEFISLVLTLTFLVGVFQLILGLARMGALVNFISHTVVIGFTAGAAILIITSQIKHFFGIEIPRGTLFYETFHQLFLQYDGINFYVVAVGSITLLAGLAFKRWLPRVPYMIGAMIVGAVSGVMLTRIVGAEHAQIESIGAITASLPPLSLPDFSFKAIHDMFFPAMVVTLLALTEAVSISRSIALKSEQHIDGNQEFIGQGVSNIAGSFFSGYASSGSFNRSGVNYSSGARTPLAAIFASIFLVLILLLVAPLATYLPTAAMAGILFLVAWGLIDFHHIAHILRNSRQESVVLIVTFVGTLINLEKGIFIGIILSLVFYLSRTSRPLIRAVVPDPNTPKRKFVPAFTADLQECPQLKMIRIDGSIFFGAVDHVKQTLHGIQEENPQQKNTLILSNGINFIDIAGAELLVQEAKRHRKLGGNLYLYGVKEGFCSTLRKGGYLDQMGRENLFPSKALAIEGIYPRLDPEICRMCQARIFHECQTTLPNGEPRPVITPDAARSG